MNITIEHLYSRQSRQSLNIRQFISDVPIYFIGDKLRVTLECFVEDHDIFVVNIGRLSMLIPCKHCL